MHEEDICIFSQCHLNCLSILFSFVIFLERIPHKIFCILKYVFIGKEHFSGMIRGLNRILDMDDDTTLPSLPRFPGKPDTMMTSPEVLEERQGALENYLNTILQCYVYRENPEMVKY